MEDYNDKTERDDLAKLSLMCQICKGAGILGMSGALVLHCPEFEKKQFCPYLASEQHVHEEIYIPPPIQGEVIVVATSAIPVDHNRTTYKVPDPKREGNTLYFIKVTPGPSTTM